MCRAFRQFPALNTATICYNDRVSGWSYTGLKETSTTFDILRAKDLTSNTGAHTLPTFAKGLAAAGVKIAKFNIGLPPDVTDSKQVRNYGKIIPRSYFLPQPLSRSLG